MNLTEFTAQVQASIAQMSREDLQQVILYLAADVQMTEQKRFLKRLTNLHAGGRIEDAPYRKVNSKDVEELIKRLNEIDEGEITLKGEIDELYSDWYDSDEEEIDYEDEDGIGETIESAAKLLHECVSCGDWDNALRLAQALTLSITGENEYDDEVFFIDDLADRDLVSLDLHTLALDSVYAVYRARPNDPTALYEMYDSVSVRNITLEDMLRYGEVRPEEYREFLNLWFACLLEQSSSLADHLLAEAVALMGDRERAIHFAKRGCQSHPGIYLAVIRENVGQASPQEQLSLGMQALKEVPQKFVIRSKIALETAETSLQAGDRETAEQCWIEAFRSSTTPLQALRVQAESQASEGHAQELLSILDSLGQSESSQVIWNRPDLQENRTVPGNQDYWLDLFICGRFQQVMDNGMQEKGGIGWSGTIMKQGLALFILLLYKGSLDSKEMENMLAWAISAFEFKREEYETGLGQKSTRSDKECFAESFQHFKDRLSISQELQRQIIDRIGRWVELRVTAIVGGTRRNYYDECAEYIAAYGAMLESLGDKGAKCRLISEYKARYPRHTAFHGELSRFR